MGSDAIENLRNGNNDGEKPTCQGKENIVYYSHKS